MTRKSISTRPGAQPLLICAVLLAVSWAGPQSNGEVLMWTGDFDHMTWENGPNWKDENGDPLPESPAPVYPGDISRNRNGIDDDVRIEAAADPMTETVKFMIGSIDTDDNTVRSMYVEEHLIVTGNANIHLTIQGDGVDPPDHSEITETGALTIENGATLAVEAAELNVNGPLTLVNRGRLISGQDAIVTVMGPTRPMLTDARLSATGNGKLSLLTADELLHDSSPGQRSTTIEANGAGSMVDLSGVKRMEGPATISADNGGTIDLSKLSSVSTQQGHVYFLSWGTGSVLNLNSRASWTLESYAFGDDAVHALSATNGGVINLPNTGMTTLRHVNAHLRCNLGGECGTITAATLVLNPKTYLFGGGTIAADVINASRGNSTTSEQYGNDAAGVVPLVGDPSRTIRVVGDYTQISELQVTAGEYETPGRLQIEISTDARQTQKLNSSLDITGVATLGGDLTVHVAESYLDEKVAKKGDSFTILTAKGEGCKDDECLRPFVRGKFEHVAYSAAPAGLKWTIAYGTDRVTVMLIPEPSATVLALVGLLGVVGMKLSDRGCRRP